MCVVCVCIYIFIKLYITAQFGSVILVIIHATRIDPPKGGLMILPCVCMCVCVCVCRYVFIKFHITAQYGPVILVVLCHSH